MKTLLFCLLAFFQIPSKNHNTPNQFALDFIRNTKNINLTPNQSKSVFITAKRNYSVQLTKKDWNYIIDDKSIWLFDANHEYYCHGKTIFKNGITLIIYSRSFFSSNIVLEKNEVVLTSFSKNGKLISSLPVEGNIGDDLYFSSTLNDSQEITTTYNKYITDTSTKNKVKKIYQKKYTLKDSGFIVESL